MEGVKVVKQSRIDKMYDILISDTKKCLCLIICHVKINFSDNFDNCTWQYLCIWLLFVLKNYKIVYNTICV